MAHKRRRVKIQEAEEHPFRSFHFETEGCCLTAGFLISGTILFWAYPLLATILISISIITFFLWAKQPKQKAVRKLNRARRYFKRHKYSKSIKILKEAHILDPTNFGVIHLLGGSLHNVGKYKEAIPYLKKFISQNHFDFSSQLVLANCFYKIKKFRHAIKTLQNVPEFFQHDLGYIHLLGVCFAAQKEYDLAINILKKAPSLEEVTKEYLPIDELMDIHYSLATIYKAANNNPDALAELKKLYAKNINYRDVAQKIEELEKVV